MAAASNPYNLLLIKLVESFPNVYDQSLEPYRDNDARNRSWAIVTFNYNGRTKLNMNVSQVIAQWKKLESDYRNYRAELKKYIPSGSGQQSEPTPCPYYAEMGFLENKVDYRSTTTTHPYGKEIEIMGRYHEELPIPQRNEGNIFRHIQDEETSNRGANKENIPS
ncbi:uncharacterized protein LOC127279908 [Leptopilina boulardi]|uniref:uncharacterized protein LOC127279908 n=1 Tax=Leptopilina boulardi TaxID=63433 RepID=UPI0021F5620F|nr:uncharacterized protein LOC127279908 [Leptopilina boulardi]